MLFTRQDVQRIAGQPAGIAKLRVNRATGGAKAQRNVPLVIRSNAAHPAPGRVRLISALLEKRPVPWNCASQLDPTNPRHRVGANCIVVEQRLVTVSESAILVPEHQPIGEAVQVGG